MNFKEKNILITGATGLVGGHLVELMLKQGARVFVIYRELNSSSYFVKQSLSKQTKNICADIMDYEALLNIINKNKIEFVFHLAAQLKVVTLHQTFAYNIMGMNNILEACKNSPSIKGVVVSSSNRAYVEGGLSAKEMQMLSQSPYDISKTAADLIAQSYYHKHKLPIVICRFGNVYGPGDLYNRVVSLIIKNIISGQTLQIQTSKSKRSYIYAGDVANGLLLAAQNLTKLQGQAVSLSTNNNFSVEELIKKISKIVGKECRYKIVGTMPNDIIMKKLKTNPAQKILKWKPVTSFEKGINETYNWYKS